jgi:hypothetical protein
MFRLLICLAMVGTVICWLPRQRHKANDRESGQERAKVYEFTHHLPPFILECRPDIREHVTRSLIATR